MWGSVFGVVELLLEGVRDEPAGDEDGRGNNDVNYDLLRELLVQDADGLDGEVLDGLVHDGLLNQVSISHYKACNFCEAKKREPVLGARSFRART